MGLARDGSGLYICETGEDIRTFILVYRSDSGRTGFDADKIGMKLARQLLQGAWMWNVLENRAENLSAKLKSLEDPYMVVKGESIPGKYHQRITFYEPSVEAEALLSEAAPTHADSTYDVDFSALVSYSESDLRSAMPTLLNLFNRVGVWKMAQLEVEFFIWERDRDKFAKIIDGLCAEAGIHCNFVPEEDLPQW